MAHGASERYEEGRTIEIAGSREAASPEGLFEDLAREVGSRFAMGEPFAAEGESGSVSAEEGIWVSDRAMERPISLRVWVALGGVRYAFGVEGRAYEYLDGGYRLLWAQAEPEGLTEEG